MAAPKTRPTDADVDAFVAAVPHPRRRADAVTLLALMRKVTGTKPRMWGPTMVGFGPAEGAAATEGVDGPAGDAWFTLGFAPRSAALTIYGLNDAAAPDPRLADLGPHTTGASCIYVKRLDAVDLDLLRDLVADAWRRSAR